jgi:hypothetical protein
LNPVAAAFMADQSGLKLYVDLLSQPARAVTIFCRVNKIEAEEISIEVAKGECRTEEFKSIIQRVRFLQSLMMDSSFMRAMLFFTTWQRLAMWQIIGTLKTLNDGRSLTAFWIGIT